MDDEISSPSAVLRAKLGLRAWVLRFGRIKRIHIVGCARSGTTMLHYAMAAFANTILIDEEVSAVSAPSMKQATSLSLRNLMSRDHAHLVTKRGYGWYEPENLRQLTDCVLRERIGVINILRDPRAVLTSQISGVEGRKYYVEPERWRASVVAGEELFEQLGRYPLKVTVRYEDLVSEPGPVADTLARTFGLSLRPGIESLGRLRDNLEHLDAVDRFSRHLGEIRNFDPSTIGRWREDPEKVQYVEGLLAGGVISSELQTFMGRFDYRE